MVCRTGLLLFSAGLAAGMLEGLMDLEDHPTDYQSDEVASAEFLVCRGVVDEMHKSLGADRSHKAVTAAFANARVGLPEEHQSVCDHFMNEQVDDVVSLLQVESGGIADLANFAPAMAGVGGGLIASKAPPAYNAFGEVDKAKMETFWKDKGQYCSSCLGIMGRLTRYLNRNSTKDAMHQRLRDLCRHLPQGLQQTCMGSFDMGLGGYVISEFLAANKLSYLCLKAGLCEATVIVSPKASAYTNKVAFANYAGEPVVVPPKSYTKPIITFPSDKTKPPTLRFAQNDQYNREPEVTLKKENFYDHKLLQGTVVRKMKEQKNPFDVVPLPPKPASFEHVLAIKEVSFLETEQVDNITDSEPTIQAPPFIAKKETRWWKVPGADMANSNTPPLKSLPDLTPEGAPMFQLSAPPEEEDEGIKVKIAPPNFFDPQVMINTKEEYRQKYQSDEKYVAPMEGIPATPIGDQGCLGALGQPGGRGPCLRMGGLQVGGMGPIIPGEANKPPSPEKFVGIHPLYHRACAICQFMIKSMDEFMRSSRTLRSLSPLIARLCDKCNTKDESARCKGMIQKHGYKMYQIFVTKLQADQVCPKQQLCEEEYFLPTIDLLPETYKKINPDLVP